LLAFQGSTAKSVDAKVAKEKREGAKDEEFDR
jgi:hypothetical protein